MERRAIRTTLASPSLALQVAGFSEWHIDADEPPALDYNLEFKIADPFTPGDPYRASDHDPLLVNLDLGHDSRIDRSQ